MRKRFYSLVLIAAGLLIGTQGWAEIQEGDVCKIGDKGYATLQAAIDDVPTTNDPTTITMVDNVSVADVSEGNYKFAVIQKSKNVVLDLAGFKIEVTSTSLKETAVFEVFGSLTLMDSSNPSTGLVSYNRLGTENNTGSASTIINHGTLIIKSGTYKLLSDLDSGGDANYIIDNVANGNEYPAIVCTIENGTFWSSIEVVRNFTNSSTCKIILNILNGEFYGAHGIVWAQLPGNIPGQSQEINITNGNFVSDNNPLVRVGSFSNEPSQLENSSINISGGTANVDVLKICQYSFNGEIDGYQEGLETAATKLFNIRGGTFNSSDYKIFVTGVTWKEGQTSTDGQKNQTYDYILPTLLNQDYYDKNNQDGTITVTNVHPQSVTDLQGLKDINNEEGVRAELNTSIVIPTGDEVSVAALVVKDATTVTIEKGAKLIVGDGGIVVEEGSKIIVEAGGILRVGVKGIENLNTNELIVRTNTEASGVVSLAPKALMRQDTKLTVEMTSKARYDDAYFWQYIGIPTNDEPIREKVSGNAFYLYEWDATAQDWQAASSFNKPFMGYIFSSNASTTGAKYNFSGNINNNQNVTFDLKPKWNLLANSYMAPIDLASFFEAMNKTAGVEAAISIYDANQGAYKVVTRDALKYDNEVFTTLAPMQGFFINTSNGGNCTFDYEQCVWGQESNEPLRTPSREDNSNVSFMKINVSSNHHADEFAMFIGEKYSSSFDNGADASKFMNDHMNLYASLDDNVLASLAVNDLAGTQLSFEAGEDVEYTMTFSNRNNDNFVLVDHLTNAQVAMTDGATYTFVATPNETTENRFEIRKASGVVTNLAEMKAAHAVKGIYTAAGQYVGKADRWNTLPAGMYIVDGVRMAK